MYSSSASLIPLAWHPDKHRWTTGIFSFPDWMKMSASWLTHWLSVSELRPWFCGIIWGVEFGNELESTWRGVILVYFKLLSQHLSGMTEEIRRKSDRISSFLARRSSTRPVLLSIAFQYQRHAGVAAVYSQFRWHGYCWSPTENKTSSSKI
jgi:hypothetical protein